MTEVPIASRTLAARQNDAPIKIELSLFAPVRHDEGDWSCRYEIAWPGAVRAQAARGVDAMQALLLAMNAIAAELYAGRPSTLEALTWLEPGGGFGLPLPPALRDLARGDDREL